MHRFEVPDMSCGHCVATVTKAIRSTDPAATIDVDLDTKEVRIGSDTEAAVLAAAMLEAGYPARSKAQ